VSTTATRRALRLARRSSARGARSAALAAAAATVGAAALLPLAESPDAARRASFGLSVAWTIVAVFRAFDVAFVQRALVALDTLPLSPAVVALDRARAVFALGAAPLAIAAIVPLTVAMLQADTALGWAAAQLAASGVFVGVLTAGAVPLAAERVSVARRAGADGEVWLAAPGAVFVIAAAGLLVVDLGFGEPTRVGGAGLPRSFVVAVGLPMLGALVVGARGTALALGAWHRLAADWVDAAAALVSRYVRSEEVRPLGPPGVTREAAVLAALERSAVRAAPALQWAPWLLVGAALALTWRARFAYVPPAAALVVAVGMPLAFAARRRALLAPLESPDGLLAGLPVDGGAAVRAVQPRVRRWMLPVLVVGSIGCLLPGGGALAAAGAAATLPVLRMHVRTPLAVTMAGAVGVALLWQPLDAFSSPAARCIGAAAALILAAIALRSPSTHPARSSGPHASRT
jgi:hypothetical protein